ncbi:MAG: ArnT family glycosyltransferase [Vicinamibacterales bacterium]
MAFVKDAGAWWAGAAAGLGLWATGGTLDFTSSNGELVRVAMLPAPFWALLLALAGGVLAAAVSARAGRRVILPLYAAPLLTCPYLPFVADWLPGLTVLAGPLKYMIWVLVACFIAWALIHARPDETPPQRECRLVWVSASVFAVSLAAYGTTAAQLAGAPLFPGGDEPHYLVIAQSLWRDGDLRIENNHRRGDTLEYYATDLEPHFLARGVDGEIYSVHPVGLPVLLAPVYALGGYRAVVALLIVVSAVTAWLSWRLAHRVTGSITASLFGWMACTLSAPFVFNSFTVYPEMCAGLLAVMSFGLVTRDVAGKRCAMAPWTAAGMLVALLPWLSTKYAFMAGALGLIALGRMWSHRRVPSCVARTALAFIVPCAISLACWFGFFWWIWGTPSPSAPYGAESGTNAANLLAGVPGLLFDQEYGLLAVAPALAIGLLGLGTMFSNRNQRRLAIEVAAVAGGLLALVGAFHIWWGGSAAVGRPLVAALPLLSVPAAVRFRSLRFNHGARLIHIGLLVVGLGITVVLMTVGDGVLLVTQRNGQSPLLGWLSPWDLSVVAPSFIVTRPMIAAGQAAIWVLAFALASRAATRRAWSAAAAGAVVVAAGVGAVCVATTVMRPLFGRSLPAPKRLELRAEVPLLNAFSPSRRPLIVRFTPFERLSADDLVSAFRFVARPDDQRPDAPVPLLYNGRWTLPAGRYRVELIGRPGAQSTDGSHLALQVGRLGLPLLELPVHFDSDGRWNQAFTLPVKADSVGFRATPDIEMQQPALVLTPIHVEDVRSTLPPLDILQAGRLGDASIFFHDDRTTAEPTGFWTQGDATTIVTIASGAQPVTHILLRAGPVATSLRVSMGDQSRAIQLQPGESLQLPVPVRTTRPWRATFDTSTTFVPSEIDPAARDRRRLGCWVELVTARE